MANALQAQPVNFDNIDHLIPEGSGPLGWRKSHLPPKLFWLLPWDGVLLIRNPKGVAVSYYNYQLKMDETSKHFNDWLEAWVLKGDPKWGRWDEHLAESRMKHTGPEVWYKDLVSNPVATVRLITDAPEERCIVAAFRSTFHTMQQLERNAKKQWKHPEIPFVREGLDGGWEKVLDKD